MQAFVLQEFLSQPRCVQRCAEMNASISCAWSATVFEELAVDGAGPAHSAACGSSYRRCSAWLGLYRWPVIWPDATALDGGGTASHRWYCASVDGFIPVPQHWRAGEPDGTDRNDGHVGHCAAIGADGLLTDASCASRHQCACERRGGGQAASYSERMATIMHVEMEARWRAWLPGLVAIILAATLPPGSLRPPRPPPSSRLGCISAVSRLHLGCCLGTAGLLLVHYLLRRTACGRSWTELPSLRTTARPVSRYVG